MTNKIIEKYQVQLDNDVAGTTPFYQTKSERLKFKQAHKVVYGTKTGWHEKLGYRAVLNVPPTPQSKLASMIKNVIKSNQVPRGYKIMVRETNGSSLKNKICNFINPWPKVHCTRPQCLVCSSKDDQTASSASEGDCWTAGVTYSLTCNLCKKEGIVARYEGESSRSCHTRGAQHLKNLEARKSGTPLGDHSNTYHPEAAGAV